MIMRLWQTDIMCIGYSEFFIINTYENFLSKKQRDNLMKKWNI